MFHFVRVSTEENEKSAKNKSDKGRLQLMFHFVRVSTEENEKVQNKSC